MPGTYLHIETEQSVIEPSARFLVGTPFGFPDLAFPEWAASIPAGGASGTKIRPSPLVWAEVGMMTSSRPPAREKQRKAAVEHREGRANSAL